MAATWTCKIDVTDVPAKLVTVTGTRTDGADVRTYVLSGVSVDTHDSPLATIKAKVVDGLYRQYAADVTKAAASAAMIAGWEAAVAAALNAKEA
jgi:hypothetical protein